MAEIAFGNSLFDFYKIMSPLDGRTMQTSTSTRPVEMAELLKQVYIQIPTPGAEIIKSINNRTEAAAAGSGGGYLFNTMNQLAANVVATYLKDVGLDGAKTGESAYFGQEANFYNDVCNGKGEPPPVAITINVLRTSGLTEATRNVDEIEFFLNHMPSIFPSMMSPYLNVEIQFPDLGGYDVDGHATIINRPSLERFLMGSSIADDKLTKKGEDGKPDVTTFSNNLTTVDLALMSAIKTGENKKSAFMGMEMFTSPQTLINMDQLGEKAGVRLNEVKPFLPPATILEATINTMNGGAGTFLHKAVDLELKIHDKARLAEFSEFLRGPSGTQNVIVWLTYGWLSPRIPGNNDLDHYAKFINENMLIREAFEVKNSSFSFDVVGQVSVKIELVAKGITAIDSAKIELPLTKTQKENAIAMEYIKQNRELFGTPSQDSTSNIKIYQILDSAVAGDPSVGMTQEEFANTLIAAGTIISQGKLSATERERANKVIKALNDNYAKTEGANRSNLELQEIREIKINFRDQFKFITDSNNKDPFLPRFIAATFDKKPFFEQALIDTLAATNTGKYKKLDSAAAELTRAQAIAANAKASLGDSKSSIASFGKLFCVFCMPTLAEQAKKEGVDEIQVSFYQLNESCGPISLHSIAEFPVDVNSFKAQFADFCMSRGGEAISIQEFLKFALENQFADHRSPGYGMRMFYEPFDITQANVESLQGEDKEYQSDMAGWIAKYGEFKLPNISFKIETVIADKNNVAKSKVDLLQHLQSKVGAGVEYKSSLAGGAPDGAYKIKKIVIYDKQLSPYTDQINLIESETGKFTVYNGKSLSEQYERRATTVVNKSADGATPATPSPVSDAPAAALANSKPRQILGGKNVLKEYLAATVPTLTIGANGSLITSVTLASKTSGLIGTNNIQGGSSKVPSTLSPNGLSMGQNSLPMRLLPAQLTMTSLGCPIAQLYQQYFVDFGTGTTIDNLYAVTQLSHKISPGKFETSWTFAYADAYGKFFGAPKLSDYINTEITVPKPAPVGAPKPAGKK